MDWLRRKSIKTELNKTEQRVSKLASLAREKEALDSEIAKVKDRNTVQCTHITGLSRVRLSLALTCSA